MKQYEVCDQHQRYATRWARSPELAAQDAANAWGLEKGELVDVYTQTRGLHRQYRVLAKNAWTGISRVRKTN